MTTNFVSEVTLPEARKREMLGDIGRSCWKDHCISLYDTTRVTVNRFTVANAMGPPGTGS